MNFIKNKNSEKKQNNGFEKQIKQRLAGKTFFSCIFVIAK